MEKYYISYVVYEGNNYATGWGDARFFAGVISSKKDLDRFIERLVTVCGYAKKESNPNTEVFEFTEEFWDNRFRSKSYSTDRVVITRREGGEKDFMIDYFEPIGKRWGNPKKIKPGLYRIDYWSECHY